MQITTTILVPEHLREFCIGKFNDLKDGPVRFPDHLDIYHQLYDLLAKRPQNQPADTGNLHIVLPNRGTGKKPETYNYLSQTAQNILTRKLEVMMWAEAHDFFDYNKHHNGIQYLQSVHQFMRKYDINSISEDAFIKNYYRWRGRCRKKSQTRGYNKQKK